MNPGMQHGRIGFFQLLILILSVVVIAALILDTVTDLPAQASRILQFLDLGVCGVFLVDFGIRLKDAPDKLGFIKWGWIDLVASIPNVDVLRYGRLVRVLRIIRVLRGVRSVQKVFKVIFQHKLRAGAASLATAFLLLIVFSSVAILITENEAGANIKTAEDAIWWSVTTMTTVGYGDKYPVTMEGRVVAMCLMVCGIGLFGAVSGVVASVFLGNKQESVTNEAILMELRQLQAKVDELKKEKNSYDRENLNLND